MCRRSWPNGRPRRRTGCGWRSVADPDRDWLKLSYAEAKQQVDAVTQALLDRGFGPDKPVMILSSNSIEFALLTMAAMQARAPLAPVSPAYSVMSQDHAKLRYVFDLIKPGMVFVQNGEIYARALAALDLEGVLLVHVDKAPPRMQSLPWSELVATTPTDAVARSIEQIEPRTVGKFLFTSGSTGMPKAVINTQEMMCANLAMSQMARTRRPDDPPGVMLDWLPWNHTMGGNATFQGNLADGGTTYIDDGKPLPGLFEETLRNLREISPTYFANVPAGYAMLATALEKDEALAKRFFKNLNSLAYGGATLPSDLYERMEALAVKYTGYRLPFVTGWGSTETAPTATTVHWASERVGLIGLPFPGVQLKLVPTGEAGRYELRLRSVIVTPGYFRRPDLTAEMFDEEGFYKIGDAGRFVDPEDPSWGLIFDGRVVEDFKLLSGTFVLVGTLRTTAIAAATPGPAGRRDLRPRPRPCRPAGLPQHRRLPRPRGRSGRQAHDRRALGPSRRGRRPARRPRADERREQGLVDAGAARAPDDRPALGRRPRDHRQGLHQPARHARTAQGAGRQALCRRRGSHRHRRRVRPP